MIKIDDSLLEELGLLALPKEERDKLLRQIYETLEMRVGMRLAERMSDSQLDEFERFINGDLAFTEDYLNRLKPGWVQSEAYQKAMQNAQAAAQRTGRQLNENAVKTEFGALTWLETNFPDYKQVVAEELDKLKVEIKADSAKIVEALNAGGSSQATGMQTASPPAYQPPAQPSVQLPQADYSQSQYSTPQPPAYPQTPMTPPTPQDNNSQLPSQPPQPPQFPPAAAA
jgi:hypothetical protein